MIAALVYGLTAIALLVAAWAAWRLYHGLRAETSADVSTDHHDFAYQTWNTCPDCGHSWPEAVTTPGLLHRTRLCQTCAAPFRSSNGHLVRLVHSAVCDELTYRTYRANRLRRPDIAPERWCLVFDDAERFEARYQREPGNCASARKEVRS